MYGHENGVAFGTLCGNTSRFSMLLVLNICGFLRLWCELFERLIGCLMNRFGHFAWCLICNMNRVQREDILLQYPPEITEMIGIHRVVDV